MSKPAIQTQVSPTGLEIIALFSTGSKVHIKSDGGKEAIGLASSGGREQVKAKAAIISKWARQQAGETNSQRAVRIVTFLAECDSVKALLAAIEGSAQLAADLAAIKEEGAK